MSTPIQDMNAIKSAGEPAENEEKRSRAQIDYDEGRGYSERGETALAAVSLHNALRGFEEENNSEGIAKASHQLGNACLQRQEYDKAIIHFRRAWDICEKLEDHLSLVALAKQIIRAHKGLEHYAEALDLSFYLLDWYQRNNDPKGSVYILEVIAEIYTESGQREKAADAYNTAASIHANFKHNAIAESLRLKAAELKKGRLE